ncbi:MAG: carboxypeptidase regulatory-like domain-containing protein [Planctomycetota bacterium]
MMVKRTSLYVSMLVMVVCVNCCADLIFRLAADKTTLAVGEETILRILAFSEEAVPGNGLNVWQLDIDTNSQYDGVIAVKTGADGNAVVNLLAPAPYDPEASGWNKESVNDPVTSNLRQLGISTVNAPQASDTAVGQFSVLAEVTVVALADGTAVCSLTNHPLGLGFYGVLADGTYYDATMGNLYFDADNSDTVFNVQTDPTLWQERPIWLGTSGGNINDITALYCCGGTLGALVEDAGGSLYILSNNHVLARTNSALPGEPIIQPGLIDTECLSDTNNTVAHLTNFVPILFKAGKILPLNKVDAAIAAIDSGKVDPNGAILGIGVVSPDTLEPFIGLGVKKSGRTTGLTRGTVMDTDAGIRVRYSGGCGGAANLVAQFREQVVIFGENFSAGGDSGSLVVEDVNSGPRAVGLLFAGAGSLYTIANPIDEVLTSLEVTMPGGSPPEPPSPPSKATNPVPSNGTTGRSINTDVSWSNGGGATSYNVYFGVDSTPDSGEFKGNQTGTSYDPGTLAYNTTYYWRIDAVNSADTTTGDVWSFTTELIPLPGIGSISGVVRNYKTAEPIKEALVRVLDTGQEELTDAAGEYTISNIPVGSHTVKATANGFKTTTKSALVEEDSVTTVNFDLKEQKGGGKPQKAVTKAHAKKVKERNEAKLMGMKGVVGAGIGQSKEKRPVIHVYLEKDTPQIRSQVPAMLEDVPVEIIVTGPFEAF